MIRYSLHCRQGHEFEGWFANSGAYDRQAANGEVLCPLCGSPKVTKALMAPNLAGRGRAEPVETKEAAEAPPPHDRPGMQRLRELARRVRAHVTANADYVGNRFAEEARKIHNEEVEPRGIYGEATPEDARALTEEGVEYCRLPAVPEDQN